MNLTCGSGFRLNPTLPVSCCSRPRPSSPNTNSTCQQFPRLGIFFFLPVGVYTCARHGACVEVREDVWGLVLSFHHASLRDRTQVIKSGSKHLRQLRHLNRLTLLAQFPDIKTWLLIWQKQADALKQRINHGRVRMVFSVLHFTVTVLILRYNS